MCSADPKPGVPFRSGFVGGVRGPPQSSLHLLGFWWHGITQYGLPVVQKQRAVSMQREVDVADGAVGFQEVCQKAGS